MLDGQVSAPRTRETADEIDKLVAEGVPDGEVSAVLAEVKRIHSLAKKEKFKAPSRRSVRRKLFDLNCGAEPGPSAMRNSFVKSLLLIIDQNLSQDLGSRRKETITSMRP